MRRNLPIAAKDESVLPCPECGGDLIIGTVAFPFLGTPRFAYRLKTVDVAVDLTARLCVDCGCVVLRAQDAEPIRQARAALHRAGLYSMPPGRPEGAPGEPSISHEDPE